MSAPQRILIITASADDRPSSIGLDLLMADLRQRRGVEVTLWFLRLPRGVPGRRGRVVDSLRTWPPARALELVGLDALAGAVRGVRLRRWLRALDPDLVVLDDGFGGRVLESGRIHPAVVVRRNVDLPADHPLEQPARLEPDAVLSADAPEPPSGVRWIQSPELPSSAASVERERRALADARSSARERWGVPEQGTLVVGWGSDAWLDGVNLFIRSLWYLEDRFGIVAHGAWLGPIEDPDELGRAAAEAERCGLADRFHVVEPTSPADRWAGDAVHLPYRFPPEVEDLTPGALAQVPVVTFGPMDVALPWVAEIDLLDVEGAAEALADGLRGTGRWTGSWADWDRFIRVDRVGDQLLDVALGRSA